uniref:Uncharacterized protein n=1 Tax=Magallana gigas TaxID=29159 RepID=A0A8W8MMI2_MAGGI
MNVGYSQTEECSDGFYGLPTRCKKCPYPSYGAGCQSYCDCKQESCNHLTGCSISVSETEELNVKGKNNLTEEHIITPSNKTFMIWNDVTATGKAMNITHDE